MSRIYQYLEYTNISNIHTSRIHPFLEYIHFSNIPMSRIYTYLEYSHVSNTPISRIDLGYRWSLNGQTIKNKSEKLRTCVPYSNNRHFCNAFDGGIALTNIYTVILQLIHLKQIQDFSPGGKGGINCLQGRSNFCTQL